VFGFWGLGLGFWAQTPKPQSPIPNPQSPSPIEIKFKKVNIDKFIKIKKDFNNKAKEKQNIIY